MQMQQKSTSSCPSSCRPESQATLGTHSLCRSAPSVINGFHACSHRSAKHAPAMWLGCAPGASRSGSPTLARSWTRGSGSRGREAAIPSLGVALILMSVRALSAGRRKQRRRRSSRMEGGRQRWSVHRPNLPYRRGTDRRNVDGTFCWRS